MNGRFPIAMHVLTLLCTTAEKALSSETIAESVNVNPVLVRKELSNLSKHGLVCSREGKNGGYSLGRDAADIDIAAIYDTVRSPAILGEARNRPNPLCEIGKQMDGRIKNLYIKVDDAVDQTLKGISLAEFCKDFIK